LSARINLNAGIRENGAAALFLCSEASAALNPRWAPPEVLDTSHFSALSDIYSFGLVLFELISREVPFRELAGGALAEGLIKEAVCSGRRPVIPSSCPAPIAALIEECWHGQPRRRPSAVEIVHRLHLIAQDYAPELLPFLYQDAANCD
jgi:serine/threonine protein kinase